MKRSCDLPWALACAAHDGEGVAFNRGRLKAALNATKIDADCDAVTKFRRALGFAWLSAPDGVSRRMMCHAIHAHLVETGQPVVTGVAKAASDLGEAAA